MSSGELFQAMGPCGGLAVEGAGLRQARRMPASRRSTSSCSIPRARTSWQQAAAPGETVSAAKALAMSVPVSQPLCPYQASTIFLPG